MNSLPYSKKFTSSFSKKLTFLFLLLFIGLSAFAQNGNIKGTVKTSDGKPAEYVNISIKGSSRGTTVKTSGDYSIGNVAPGTYTLVASYTGLITQTKEVTVASGLTTVADFTLSENDQQLQEVVVSTAKHKITEKSSDMVARMPITNLQNPQVYSVVSKELMKQQNVVVLTDAFRNAAGVAPILYPSGGIAALSRGFSTDVNARNGVQTTAGRSSADVANIERIEFIKGPSGTLFGAGISSFGGVVNLVTKRPHETFQGTVDLSMGSFALGRIAADVNAPLNEDKTLLLRVNAATQRQDSYNERGFANTSIFAPSLLYKVNDRFSLLLDAEIYTANTVRPTYVQIMPGSGFKSFADIPLDYKKSFLDNDLDAKTNATKFFGEAKYRISDNWTSTTNISYVNEGVERSYQDYPVWIKPDSVTIDISRYGPIANTYTNLQQNFNGKFNTGSLKHTFLAGANFNQYVSRGRSGSTGVIATLNVNDNNGKINRELVDGYLTPSSMLNWGRNNINTYGVYASDVVNINDRLYAMLSLRYEYIKDASTGPWAAPYSQSSLSPKLGLVYQVVKEKVSIFGNYMNGYQNYAPIVQPDGSTFSPKPIYAIQYEGGIKAELLDKRISTTLSYYNIGIDNAVRYATDFTAYQDGEQKSQGIEWDFSAAPADGLTVILGYGYNKNQILNTPGLEGKIVSNAPQHVGNYWVNYQFKNGPLKNFGLGAGGNYVSKAYFDDANTLLLPKYHIVNASAFYENNRWRLGLKFNNLNDQKSWGFWGAPNPTRNVVANFTLKF